MPLFALGLILLLGVGAYHYLPNIQSHIGPSVVTTTYTTTLANGAVNVVATTMSSTALIIPLYTYPTDTSWQAVINAKQANPSLKIIAIINPNSGPGTSSDQNYVYGILHLEQSGITVLGYVYTGYAGESLSSVEAQVSDYQVWYGTNGIFFDGESSSTANVQYYQTLQSYCSCFTVGNPGTNIPSSYFGIFNIQIIYENAGTPSLSYLQQYSPRQEFGFVAYGVSSLDPTFVAQASQYAGAMYITNAGLPNPYDVLPVYFAQEAQLLA